MSQISQINLIQPHTWIYHIPSPRRSLPRAKLHHVKLITDQCRIHHCIDVVLLILEEISGGFASCTFHHSSFLVKHSQTRSAISKCWDGESTWINPQVLFKVNSFIIIHWKKKTCFVGDSGSFLHILVHLVAAWKWTSGAMAAKRMFYLDVHALFVQWDIHGIYPLVNLISDWNQHFLF